MKDAATSPLGDPLLHWTKPADKLVVVEGPRGAGSASDRQYVMRKALPNLVLGVSMLSMSLWGLTGPWPSNLNLLVGIASVAGVIAAFVVARRVDARRALMDKSSAAHSPPQNPPLEPTSRER